MAMTLAQWKAMFPNDDVRTGLVDIIQEQSVIMPLLNFIPVDGFGYKYGERTKLPGIGFRDINGVYTDSGGVINPRTENLVPFGGSIRTDQWMIDLRGGRARSTEVASKIRAAGLFFDRSFFKGDSATNPQSFDGLQARISTAGSQILWMGANGGAITLAALNEALDNTRGPNSGKVIHCNKTARRKISDLVLAAAGGASVSEVLEDGRDLYKGARFVPVEEDHEGNAILDYNETRGSSDLTTSIYIVRYGGATDESDVQGLANSGLFKTRTPVNMGEYVRDVIEMLAGLAIFGAKSVFRIGGITNA